MSDKGQSSKQEHEQEDRRHFDRTSGPGPERRMRLMAALAGPLWMVLVRLEDSDLAAPVVGVAVASIVETAPENRQTLIFAPGSIHWPCLCPSFEFARTVAHPVGPSEVVGVTWSSWSGCGRRASAAGGEKRRSLFGIGLEGGRRRCGCRQHFVVGIDHSLLASSKEASVLVAGSLPCLAARKDLSRGREWREVDGRSISRTEKSCY